MCLVLLGCIFKTPILPQIVYKFYMNYSMRFDYYKKCIVYSWLYSYVFDGNCYLLNYYNLVGSYHLFSGHTTGIFRIYDKGDKFLQTFVTNYKIIWWHNAEAHNQNSRHCENPISYTFALLWNYISWFCNMKTTQSKGGQEI